MIKKHVHSGEMVFAHADNEKNIMCIHAGFEKNLLIKAIGLINPRWGHI